MDDKPLECDMSSVQPILPFCLGGYPPQHVVQKLYILHNPMGTASSDIFCDTRDTFLRT